MNVPTKRMLKLSEERAFKKLRSIGQEKLFTSHPHLQPCQKQNLLNQIAELDLELFSYQRKTLNELDEKRHAPFSPFENVFSTTGTVLQENGLKLIKEGKTALVILSGGQGSRLRCAGPKGCCEITLIKHKSLYQLLAEKVVAAGRQVGREVEVAFMTSPLNHDETILFFKKNNFFGLNPKQVTFFNQKMWPFLNFHGDLFLEEIDKIAQGPNGNGSVFKSIEEWGIWEKWNKKGIEYVQILPIDNPLATPFDPELFGFHIERRADVSLKTDYRRHAAENVGVLANIGGKVVVVEYFELNESDRNARNLEGKLKYGFANLGIYCFSMELIKKISHQKLPLHKAKKVVQEMDATGNAFFPDKPNAWKFEEFIFDALLFADNVQALLCPRESCFAPLKNLKGEDSINTVRAALLEFDRKTFTQVTGNEPPDNALFELSPQFYYPTAELLEKWRSKPFPHKDYIHE